MASIKKLQEDRKKAEEKLKETEKELQEKTVEINSWLGEALSEELNLNYESITYKKDAEEIVSLITNEMKTNPFTDNSDENQEQNIENSDINDREEIRQ